MNDFIESISSREKSLLIWVFLIFILFLFKKELRKCLSNILKAFFAKSILILTLLFLIYNYAITLIFIKVGFWEIKLLKDTLIWLIGSAFILIFNSISAKDSKHFREIIKDTIKWGIFVEFLIGFYTFNFLTEFLLLPLLTIIYGIISYSEAFSYRLSNDAKKVGPILKSMLSFLGFFLLGFIIYKTFTQSKELLTTENLKSFLLPIFFTLAYLPFVYFIALYSKYEELWNQIDFLVKDKSKQGKLKKYILIAGNLNINKISNISDHLSHTINNNSVITLSIIKKISNGYGQPKSNQNNYKVKIDIFNDIDKLRNKLIENGIGKLGNWKQDSPGNFYCSTGYYSLENKITLGLPNNLAYYLESKNEYYVEELKLVLNINDVNQKKDSLGRFKEVIIKTYESLKILPPQKILNQIGKSKNIEFEDANSISKLVYEKSKIETWKLIINTK